MYTTLRDYGAYTEKGYVMELIVIGENRLKIMLTGEDMARYDLTEPEPLGEAAGGVTPHTREVLRHIFADAHSEIGFDTEGERLFVQLYASKGGGCEIFVTKLGETGEARLLKKIFLENETSCTVQEQTICLYLHGFNDLTALCRRLADTGFRGSSRLYISPRNAGAWYLFLSIPVVSGKRHPFPFLYEYGEEAGSDIGMYLGEYGQMICDEGAVELMGQM